MRREPLVMTRCPTFSNVRMAQLWSIGIFGDSERATHGGDTPRPLATAMPDLRPSSWKPQPHHAPQNHVFCSPWMLGSRSCASRAAKLKDGCDSSSLRTTVSAAGGVGGLSVTKRSTPSSQLCKLFTQ